jgi:hypothetical protein
MSIPTAMKAPEAAGETAPTTFGLRRMAPSAVVIVGYIVIGVVAYWPVFPISSRLFGHGGDFAQSVWFIAWVPHALAHGLNPFFSNAMYAPGGVNLAANTSSPLLGLIATPLALVLDPAGRTNLLILMAMPASASAAFVVLRRWQVWMPAAALGGLMYGFSPYMVGESLAHVEFLFVPLPPFIVLVVSSILQGRSTPRRLGVLLGLLLAGQFLISPEIFATVAIFTIVAVCLVAVRQPGRALETLGRMWRPVGIALAVMAALLAYPVWMMVAGPQHTTGAPFGPTNAFHNDLFSFVVPGPLQRVSLGMRSIGDRLAGASLLGAAEGYIGIPVLILSGALFWRSRRSPRMQLVAVLLVAAALLSLGPRLAVDGRLTTIPLPFSLLDRVPFLKDLLPSRVSFEIGACVAAVIAFGLDDIHRVSTIPARSSPVRRGRMDVTAVCIAFAVLVGTQLPWWPQQFASSPVPTLPASLRRAVPPGNPLAITYPYALYQEAMQPMLWHAEADFSFRLLGGYGHHPIRPSGPSISTPSVMTPPNLQQFLAGQQGATLYGPPLPVTPGLVEATRAALSRYRVRLVIVDRSTIGSASVVELFDKALGLPAVSASSFSLWSGWRGTRSTGIRTS